METRGNLHSIEMSLFDVSEAVDEASFAPVHGLSSGIRFVITPKPQGNDSPLSSPSVSIQPKQSFISRQSEDTEWVSSTESPRTKLHPNPPKRFSHPNALKAFLINMRRRSEVVKAKAKEVKKSANCRKNTRTRTHIEARSEDILKCRSHSYTIVKSEGNGELTQAKRLGDEESPQDRLERNFNEGWKALRLGSRLVQRQELEAVLAYLSRRGYQVDFAARSLWPKLGNAPRYSVLRTISIHLGQRRQKPVVKRKEQRCMTATPLMTLSAGTRHMKAVSTMQEALRQFIEVSKSSSPSLSSSSSDTN